MRLTTTCNNRCLFCLDALTPRDIKLPVDTLKQDIARGRSERGAERLILSGGEPTLHPAFLELCRYAKGLGYQRVQIVTNGHKLADRSFFEATMEAGLGEITFSLHGHTAELHDRLTGTPGSFQRLMKGLVRAKRDGRPIVNVDIVINRQNVAVVWQIVELCLSLGVSEFDLLHLIPQGRAFEHRDELFYDVRENLPALQKVFRLHRHPRIVVWTNRFPVAFLEGLEELIQDPHKLLDEVRGRRFQVRRYLDLGEVLDCREPERCPHCFIEPFCTTVDRVVHGQNHDSWQVWWIGDEPWRPGPLPYGCSLLGVARPDLAALAQLDLPAGTGRYARLAASESLPPDAARSGPLILITGEPAQLDAWLGTTLPDGVEVDIELNRRTAPWLLEHESWVLQAERLRLHQPSHEHLSRAQAEDLPNLRSFFRKILAPLRVSGLPPCLAPGAPLVKPRRILPRAIFEPDTGRLHIQRLARYHIVEGYRAKSVRCADCRVTDRCEGAHINLIRHAGLAALRPLTTGADALRADEQLRRLYPEPPPRLATGRPPEPVAPSLPGFPGPEQPPLDPLAEIELDRMKRAGLSVDDPRDKLPKDD